MKSALRSAATSDGSAATWLAAVPFVVVMVVFAGIYVGVADRLPDPLATHFRGERADGFSSVPGFLTESLALLLALGSVFGLLIHLRVPAPDIPWLIAGCYVTAAGLGHVLCGTLLANAGVSDASAVREPWWQLPVGLGVALFAGALGRLLAGAAPPRPPQEPGATSRLDLPAGTTAGWSRTISSPR